MLGFSPKLKQEAIRLEKETKSHDPGPANRENQSLHLCSIHKLRTLDERSLKFKDTCLRPGCLGAKQGMNGYLKRTLTYVGYLKFPLLDSH